MRCLQWVAFSYAYAARSTPTSFHAREAICRPTGRPALVVPHGTDAAGCWVRLNGRLNPAQLCQRSLPHPSGTSRPAPNGGTAAFRTSPLDPQARALVAAIERTTGERPVQLRTLGGTVPIAPFIEALGFPAVIVPIVNFDNNQHEENENLRLGNLFSGIEILGAVAAAGLR